MSDRRRLRPRLDSGRAGEARTAGARQVAANVAQQYSGRVLGLVVSLATIPLLARTLGTGGFGVWSAALAYVTIFSTLTEFGLTSAATMRMAGDPDHEAEWLGALASLRTLVSVGTLIACAALIPLILGSREARLTGLVLTGTVLFAGASALMSVYFSRLRGAIPLAISVLQSLLWLGVVVTLAVVDAGPVLVAVGYTSMLGVVAVVQVLATRRLATVVWRDARERWVSLLRIAVPTGLAYVFSTIYFSADAVLLLALSGEEEAGIYGAAYRFLAPLLFLPQALMGAVFPVMSSLSGSDDARLRRIVERCANYAGLITLPVLAVAVVLSGPIVALVFGPEFSRTAEILPVLMVAYVAIGYGTLGGFLGLVLGLRWRLTLYAFIGAVINIGLNLIVIPEYGALGSAWATVVTECATMALLLVTSLRRLELRLPVSRLIATVAAAGLMALAMLAARPLGLLPALVAGGLTYPLAVLALRVVTLEEVRAIVGRPQDP